LPGVASRRPLHQDALARADHPLGNRAGLGVQPPLQQFEPVLLHGVRHRVGQRRGGRARPAAVDEAERLVEAHLGDQVHGRLEVLVGLARESDDDVRGDANVRPYRAQLADSLLVLEHGMAALHRRQDPVGAALHGKVQVIVELRHVGIRLDQAVVEIERVRGGEADALHAVDRGDEVDQGRKVRGRAVLHRPGIGVHVLAQERHLTHALPAQAADLFQHLLEGAADLLAARVRHHAKTAVLAAAFHDRHEGGGAGRPRRG
jgi:hypothetical protein